MDGPQGMRDVVIRLRALEGKEVDGGGSVSVPRNELSRLLTFVEKATALAERANELLVHAYSMPGDEQGVRFLSEDAVRLQWALREIGVGDDSAQTGFTV